MTENIERPRRGFLITVVVVVIAAVAVIAFAIVQLRGSSGDPEGISGEPAETSGPADEGTTGQGEPTDDAEDPDSSAEGSTGEGAEESTQPSPPLSEKVLPKEMSGQEAIDALGDKIEIVAKRNGKTVDELKNLLLDNPSAHVMPNGSIVYNDTFSND